MKSTFWLCFSSCALGIFTLTAGAFEPRKIDGGHSMNPSITPADSKNSTVTRTVTYCVLAAERAWTSTDDKKMQAKLIAFEDLTVEVKDGAVVKAAEAPAHPTVVQNEKVRFLINRKPVELPLSRLVQADQDFIEKIRLQHAPAKPKAGQP